MTIPRLIPAIASVLIPCVAIGAQPVLRLDGIVDPAVFSLPAGTQMRLELPDGRGYPIVVRSPRLHPSGNVTWRARIVDQGHDGFIVTLTGNPESGLFGTALTPSGEYRVAPQPGRWNEIKVSAADLVPYRSMFDTLPSKVSAIGSPMTAVRSGENHATDTPIDVVVYYTESAREGFEEDAAWAAYLDNLFEVANEAHQQSGTMVQLNRVGTLAFPLSDETTSNAELLAQLTTVTTENQRLHRGAHLFTLLRGWKPSHGTCGSAHVPVCGDDADCYDALFGYSVVSVGPDCPALELAHQIGHNLGSAHENPGSMPGTFDYSHGHVTAGGVGTVMAVGGASQVAYFSDPDSANCGGDPCGVDDLSDNVRSIEITRHHIARWIDERRIGLAGAPVELEQGVSNSNTLDIDRFGVVGGRHDLSLWRNDDVVIADLASVTYLDETVTFNVPFTVPLGTGYVVRFTSTVRPDVFFDTPATVVEAPTATVFSFTETFIDAPGTGGAITLTVARTGELDGDAQIRYQTTGGSASGNFTPADGTLSWANGEGGTKTFTVNNVRSAQSGQVTSLFVVLSDPSPGARVGAGFRVEIRVAGRAGGGGGGGFSLLALAALLVMLGLARRP